MKDIKEHFNKQGFAKVNKLFSEVEVKSLLTPVKTIITNHMHDFTVGDYRRKTNLLFKEVADLAVSDPLKKLASLLLGDSYFCYDIMVWAKPPAVQNSAFVSYHQDGTYWNINHPINGVIVWIPLMDVSSHQGPVEYIPDSHISGIHAHTDLPSSTNLLRRGQTIMNIDDSNKTIVECVLGDAVAHTPYTVHCSGINLSNQYRLALSVQYATSDCTLRLAESTEVVQHIAGSRNAALTYSPELSSDYLENLEGWRRGLEIQYNNYVRL